LNYQIKSRYDTTNILYQTEAKTLAALIQAAVKAGANLYGANLYGANLQSADLLGADLQSANLQNANLQNANLRDADLQSANLRDANLRGADLQGADLRGADLQSANLRGANLLGADLRGANLQSANLLGANLLGADLRGAKNISDKANAETSILPDSGPFVGWKKCRDGVIVQLAVPSKAARSNATGRKCRAEFVKTLKVFGADQGVSQYDASVIYAPGRITRCSEKSPWNPDRWVECGGGIHFFLTRYEAEHY
jgi:hypothetical protein